MAGAEAKTRSGVAWLRLLGVAAALTPAPAIAGAWIAPEGGQEIVTSGVGERDDLVFYEGGGYYEAPLGEDDAIVFAPWSESDQAFEDGWRAEALLGAKHVIYRDERSVMALQASGLWISHPGDDCSEGGAELR